MWFYTRAASPPRRSCVHHSGQRGPKEGVGSRLSSGRGRGGACRGCWYTQVARALQGTGLLPGCTKLSALLNGGDRWARVGAQFGGGVRDRGAPVSLKAKGRERVRAGSYSSEGRVRVAVGTLAAGAGPAMGRGPRPRSVGSRVHTPSASLAGVQRGARAGLREAPGGRRKRGGGWVFPSVRQTEGRASRGATSRGAASGKGQRGNGLGGGPCGPASRRAPLRPASRRQPRAGRRRRPCRQRPWRRRRPRRCSRRSCQSCAPCAWSWPRGSPC